MSRLDDVARCIDRELAKEQRAKRAKAKAAATREHPLRKVLRIDGMFQVLSCGHRVRPRQDVLRIYDNVKSRRCEQCTKDKHPERYCRTPECTSAPREGGLCYDCGRGAFP